MSSSYDLPLDKDSSAKFIPWVISLTTFVALVLITGTFVLSSFVGQWSQSLNDHITIQVPHTVYNTEENAHQVSDLLKFLRLQPAVKSAEIVDREEVHKLLDPWLGENYEAIGLPNPTLLSVTLRSHYPFDSVVLSGELNKIVSGVMVQHHEHFHKTLVRLTAVLQVIGNLIVALVTLASIGTLIFSTYTGLVVHRDVIDIMRLIGARPKYIARQFQHHTLKLSIKGVIYGMLLIVGMVLLVRWFVGPLDMQVLPLHYVSLSMVVGVFVTVPFLVVLATTLTTRFTVDFVLNRDAHR